MIGRVIWIAILLAIAGLTAGVQLDRQAAKTPELASYVPDVFRSSSQPRIAALAIDSGVSELGLEEAQKLISRRPIPARHLRLLAQAQFEAGQIDESGIAIQYAAQRGWREPIAQEAMMRLALAAGDRPEAARRFAALLLMRRSDLSRLEEVGLDVFPNPGGAEREVFAAIVSGGDRWHAAFLNRGARTLPVGAYVDILERSMALGAVFQCADLEQSQRYIARRDEGAGVKLSVLIDQQCQ